MNSWMPSARCKPWSWGAKLGAHLATARWIIAGAALLAAMAAAAAPAWPERAGQAPRVGLMRLDGGPLALTSLTGKPVVMSFWASWCEPCRHELPILRRAQMDHPDITFVLVNHDETPATIRAYLAAQHLKLDNVVLDTDERLAKQLKIDALPTTIFFDKNGVMLDRRLGKITARALYDRLAAVYGGG